MRAHYLQHVPFEGLGSIEPWLLARGFEIGATRLFAGEPLPKPSDIDVLIAMGGPMSVNDEDEYSWLRAEKHFIREYLSTDRPLLGICLGAQLIAVALGARVAANRHKEIGWFEVKRAQALPAAAYRFPDSFTAFHWHGETFDLPAGATPLASSAACERQAFQIGRSVIGLQFHLETTPDSARALVENCSSDLVVGERPEPYVQTATALLDVGVATYARLNALMDDVLEYLLPGAVR